MNLTTPVYKLFVARPAADENGASGAPSIFVNQTAGDFDSMPSGVIDILDPAYLDPTTETSKGKALTHYSKVNGLFLSFTGGDAANDTFTYDIYTWANENGHAKHSVNGTCTLGTQQVVKYPHNNVSVSDKFWADTISVTWENHPKEVESTSTTGRNSIAELWFDMTGLRYLFVQISKAGGTGTEAEDVSAFFRYM
jgi:hypothetical protein